jgi:DNA ligase-associated metallophosphoesterase
MIGSKKPRAWFRFTKIDSFGCRLFRKPVLLEAMKVNGEEIELDPSGAAYLPGSATLMVADLHFEKASAFAQRGRPIPPYDTLATLDSLCNVIDRIGPKRVVCLGDSFHDEGAGDRLDPGTVLRFRELTQKLDWVWIEGNHDPEPPDNLGGAIASELDLGRLVLRHLPSPGAAPGEIAGHLHPKAAVRVRGRRVQGRCFASDGIRLILPSFGAFTGGLNVLHAAFTGLFAGPFHAHIIGRRGVRAVPSAKLV